MDISAMSTSVGSITSESTVLDSEEDDRAFIEISELDKLLGLPPPRFDLGAADINPVLDSAVTFDPEIEFSVSQKQGLPQRLRMDLRRDNESETEVCFSKGLAKVSVIKTELNIESDGQEMETPCHSYLTEPVPMMPLPPSTDTQDDMLYKRSALTVRGSRGKHWNRGKAGSLNRVVSKLLAKSDPPDNSILQNLLCLPENSICDNPIPKTPPTIPSPVINKLKKLGTSVEIEKPEPLQRTVNGQLTTPILPVRQDLSVASLKDPATSVPTSYLQIMESLDKAVGLTSDLTKKKKKRTQKKNGDQVPSNLKLLAEIESSDNFTKFSFQVDAKQVIELPEGQKLYTCDICSGVYHRGFSLKRHYLKTHINYKHVSKRDLHNCGILFDPSIEKGGARKKLVKDDSPPVVTNLSPPSDIADLYRCHTCGKCFMLISDLKAHLMEHPPVSVQNLAEDPFKNYACPNCKARYQKKKLYLRHKEICGTVIEPEMTATHLCLYCEKTFPSFLLRKKHHLQMHHPKKKLHQCYLCKTKMFKERLGVFKHLVLHHPIEYIGCLSCKLRFGSREELKKHNKETHKRIGTVKKLLIQQNVTTKNQYEGDVVEKSPHTHEAEHLEVNNTNPNLVIKCTECPKRFLCFLNMTRHRRLAHGEAIRKKKKRVSHKKEFPIVKVSENHKTPTPPPPVLTPPPPPPLPAPPDPEVLFYSTIAHNIRENLTHHLDGKLDSQEVMEYDLNKTNEERNKVLNFSACFTSPNSSPAQVETTSVDIQQKEPRSTPISPRAPWEKFNFPKNYDGRCGLTSYIKDMSHLDISTQLTMRRNLQRLNSTAGQDSNKESPANIPAGLLLVEKPIPDCAEAFGEPDVNKDKGDSELILSGEWVRPRTFLCAACGYKSTNLWDVEDHKYALHPNVWVPHIEIVGEQSSAWDWFYHRRLPPEADVKETTPAQPSTPPPCSKCKRQCLSMPDLHRHMLDCGGDTTWMATMLAVTSPGARRRKWRPFGSRRRGRRGLKRNIPNTPAKHSSGRVRTKPGDMDTIQKMIANLPPKRATRRVIGEDPDIKTRSQATISCVPISSIPCSSNRFSGMKSKVGKNGTKLNGQKKSKNENVPHSEDKSRNKDEVTIKEEPIDEASAKEDKDRPEKDFQPLEAENTIQHSDILTSLQMIPVVRKNPPVEELEEKKIIEGPIETSKILAAMREAMLDCNEKLENKMVKSTDKKKKSRIDERNVKVEVTSDLKKTVIVDGDIIICNGCGMQFDSSSACQRHKKKCVYWKEDKSNEEPKTNKCVNCGSIFPYLMALLKHNCSKIDVTEEPVMPELCPEKPVEEVQCDSVEDIPILSPVDVAREELVARRMLLLDSTINDVLSESFDMSSYFVKYFKTNDKDSNISTKSPDRKSKLELSTSVKYVDGSSEKLRSPVRKEKQPLSPVRNNTNTENTPLVATEVATPSKNSHPKDISPLKKLKSPGSNQSPKSQKVSEIFKEVKRRRGRRRHRVKVRVAPKLFSSKPGHRRTTTGRPTVVAKKNIHRKKRTTNFAMLMKEWEKLEKEGAVAVGKRRRVFSNPELDIIHVRRRRRIASKASYADLESISTDISSVHDRVSEFSPTRRSRRTTSIGNCSDFSHEMSFDGNEKSNFSEIKQEAIDIDTDICKHVSSCKESNISKEMDEQVSFAVVKQELSSNEIPTFKRKPGRPRFKNINETAAGSFIRLNSTEEFNNMDSKIEIKNEINSQDVSSIKRKPGRPRFKSITVETEQHIIETIDSIVKKSLELDGNKEVKRKDSEIVEKRKLISEESLSVDKTEAHVIETIEGVIKEHTGGQNEIKTKEDPKWDELDEVIYNVSIGSAGIFKEIERDVSQVSSSVVIENNAKRKIHNRRGLGNIFKTSTDSTTITALKGEGESPKQNESTEICDKEAYNVNKDKEHNDGNKIVSDGSENPIKPEIKIIEYKSDKLTRHKFTTNRRLSTASKEDKVSMNLKPREIKTRQLSIADYLSISNFVKGSSVNSAKTIKNDQNKNTGDIVSLISNEAVTENEKDSLIATEVVKTTLIKKHQKASFNQNAPKFKIENHFEDNPLSPVSTSSKEDVALSVIRDKVIQKRKKKLKLKKLLRNKRLAEVMDCKISKLGKPKLAFRDDRQKNKDKFHKGKKKVKVGVSRNRWEVSEVEKKSSPVEIFFEEDSKAVPSNTLNEDSNKMFFCSVCNLKFVSSFNLYEHQLTAEHNLKNAAVTSQIGNLSEENDPVKYCKSIGNIINDLEKRTQNVVKVKNNNLKPKDPPKAEAEPAPAIVESTSTPSKDTKAPTEDSWTQEWAAGVQQEWPSRSTTPLWEGNQQTWEVDSFSTGCSSSLGSIMDTVNKLLSSDQEVSTVPSTVGGYSWSDLQLAMGASDEEMAMLEQLGEHSLQEDYVYDNLQPAVEWPSATEEVPSTPTLTDLDHQEVPSPATLEIKKTEPLSDSEDSKSCRNMIGRPQRVMGDYDSREMVCPTCNKHFLGLPALQTHVARSHCAPVANTSRLITGLKRRNLLNVDQEHRQVCFVCKEIVSSASQLDAHILAQHTKKTDEQQASKPVLSEGAEKLKSKMALALGGLVDRALNNLLGTAKTVSEPSTSVNNQASQADLNTGALQLLGRLCAAKKRYGGENMKLSAEVLQLLGRLRAINHKEEVSSRPYTTALASEMRQILKRYKPHGVSKDALQASVNSTAQTTELKPTNLLDHLAVCSSDVQERPYVCPICDLRFLIPSTRNRHMARAHGKYGRRYDEIEENRSQQVAENDWNSSLETGVEANEDGEMLPLCSDCGLSFQSIHEVMKHRIEDHPRRFSADSLQDDDKSSLLVEKHSVVESTFETKSLRGCVKNDVKMLPVSDNAIDSTSTVKKRRGRPAKSIEPKPGQKRTRSESERNGSPIRKYTPLIGRKKIRSNDPQLAFIDRLLPGSDSDDGDTETGQEESNSTESTSPETDKCSDNLSDKQSHQGSEESLADLCKKLDRRKVRMGNLAEEVVRVKAEAALRELSVPRKSKSASSAAKWGINAVKFTKQSTVGMSSSQVNGSPSKPRFASLVEKKWKTQPAAAMELQTPISDLADMKPDIYDFRDEDMELNKKCFQLIKDPHLPDTEPSESNKLVQSNWGTSGSPRKTSNSKLSSYNS